MSRKYCCVPSCFESGDRFSRFPVGDKELFQLWLKNINNPLLFSRTPNIIYNTNRVCNKHFEDRFLQTSPYPGSNKPVVFRGAYPTLLLEDDHNNMKKTKFDHKHLNEADPSVTNDSRVTSVLSNSKSSDMIEESFDEQVTLTCAPSTSELPQTSAVETPSLEPQQIKYLTENFHEPVVFNKLIENWKILKWSLNEWTTKLGDEKLTFRKNYFIKSKEPLWEQTCEIVEMTMKEFVEKQTQLHRESWLYFDYKYMVEWFKKHSDLLQDVSWQRFGYPEKSGKDSTIWIGTEGAHTSCHKDSYGFNLIAQVYGRKKWILFPPEENLRPTRVPYEESSVYSELNFFSPNVNDFKSIANARTVTLNPGEVLFLPHGWWHYVENIETAISINVWIPQPGDHRARVEEAFTQLFVAQMTKELTDFDKSKILNPNYSELSDRPASDCVNTIEHVCKEFKNHNKSKLFKSDTTIQENTNTETVDIKQIFTEHRNVRAIPKLLLEEFHRLLQEQETKYFPHGEPYVKDEKENSVATLRKIINSVCHPDILSAITDKLLKD